jgi:hypothetical protein
MYGDELMFIDPPEKFDICIVGVANRCGLQNSVVYCRHQILLALMSDGMTESEADEYISYNIEGAYVGETTPLIMEKLWT